jgi:hypothetical protein
VWKFNIFFSNVVEYFCLIKKIQDYFCLFANLGGGGGEEGHCQIYSSLGGILLSQLKCLGILSIE